ncbi:MAG: hypothetical protein M1830_004116, partial [Pleopsidium flavum]
MSAVKKGKEKQRVDSKRSQSLDGTCRRNIKLDNSSIRHHDKDLHSGTMSLRSVALILTSLLLTLVSAASLSLVIPPSNLVPNPSTLPASTFATLTNTGRTYTAPFQRNAHFTFRNLTVGSYLLDVRCRDYNFAPLRVDVGGSDEVEVWQTFRGHEWDNKGEKIMERPVHVKVLAGKDYYEERSGFSPLSLLKNPMILLGVVGLGIVFGMPYLLDNMDPEMRAEFEEQQKKGPLGGGVTAANPLQGFDMAGWMAGSTAKNGEGDNDTRSG